MTTETANAVSILQYRLANLLIEASRNGRAGTGYDLDTICRLARVEVDWQSAEAWGDRNLGCGLLVPRDGGFTARIPLRSSQGWRRFVLGHEIGHSLFYGRRFCEGTSAGTDTVSPVKDVWIDAQREERLCDAIADSLLVTDEVLNSTLVHADSVQLEKVVWLSRECRAPLESALRRSIGWLRQKRGLENTRYEQLIVWILGKAAKTRAKAVYSVGAARVPLREYTNPMAGLRSLDPVNASSPFPFGRELANVQLPGLRGSYWVETAPVRRSANEIHILAAYARPDDNPGWFDSAVPL